MRPFLAPEFAWRHTLKLDLAFRERVAAIQARQHRLYDLRQLGSRGDVSTFAAQYIRQGQSIEGSERWLLSFGDIIREQFVPDLGHLLLPALDDRIATVSARVVDLLRAAPPHGLGFDGLVTTDALGKNPTMDGIAPYVVDSGEGRWTVDEAIELAVPAPVIAASLFARFASRQEESPALKAVAALRQQFGGHAVKPATGDGA